MYKLLSANFSRLFTNRTFWFSVIIMALTEGAFALLMLRNGPMPRENILFISLQCISILLAVFFSLFLGTEYSDGTIRNKVIVGHNRNNIYFAGFITGIIAVTIIYAAEILAGCIVGALCFAAPRHSIDEIMMIGITGWVACIAFASVFTLIGMISSSKAVTSIACILTAFASLFVGLFTFQQLAAPDSLTEAEHTVFQMLFEINPSGQLLQTMTLSIESPLKLITSSIILSIVITLIGLCIFHKKEFK